MSRGDERAGIERRDDWALADLDAAVGIIGATVGAAFGPLGSILGAFVGPYAKLAVTRFMELRDRVSAEVDLDDEQLRRRLEESEPLAQMIAEIVRGTVESDLEAKRRLLARAAIRALQDDAAVDAEIASVRASNAINAADVRILSLIATYEEGNPEDRLIAPSEINLMWEGGGGARMIESSFAMLTSAGLVRGAVRGTWGHPAGVRMTKFGHRFLEELLGEGLEEELRRRSGEGEPE